MMTSVSIALPSLLSFEECCLCLTCVEDDSDDMLEFVGPLWRDDGIHGAKYCRGIEPDHPRERGNVRDFISVAREGPLSSRRSDSRLYWYMRRHMKYRGVGQSQRRFATCQFSSKIFMKQVFYPNLKIPYILCRHPVEPLRLTSPPAAQGEFLMNLACGSRRNIHPSLVV